MRMNNASLGDKLTEVLKKINVVTAVMIGNNATNSVMTAELKHFKDVHGTYCGLKTEEKLEK